MEYLSVSMDILNLVFSFGLINETDINLVLSMSKWFILSNNKMLS